MSVLRHSHHLFAMNSLVEGEAIDSRNEDWLLELVHVSLK
jgi:hypothetical protein